MAICSDFRRVSFGVIVESKSTYVRSMGHQLCLKLFRWIIPPTWHRIVCAGNLEFIGLARRTRCSLERLSVASSLVSEVHWSYTSFLEWYMSRWDFPHIDWPRGRLTSMDWCVWLSMQAYVCKQSLYLGRPVLLLYSFRMFTSVISMLLAVAYLPCDS